MEQSAEFYTLEEFRILLGISRATLWRLRKEGRVKATRLRGGVRIHKSQIENIQREREEART